eukprot:9806942-Alexandrium_andersonii.AAC.1
MTVEKGHAMPRALADDLLLITRGEGEGEEEGMHGHFQRHTLAVQDTIEYIHMAGSRIAPAKCKTAASEAGLRALYKRHKYALVEHAFEVILHMRDLGAHVH